MPISVQGALRGAASTDPAHPPPPPPPDEEEAVRVAAPIVKVAEVEPSWRDSDASSTSSAIA